MRGVFKAILVLGLLAGVSSLWAQEASGPVVTAEVDFNSAYVWRGLTFNNGWVAEPWVDISGVKIGKVPVGINVWSNFNFSDYNGTLQKNQFSEVDISLSAELGAGFKAGYIQYILTAGGFADPSTAQNGTGEVNLAWSKEMVVTPTIQLSYDVQAIHDFFLLLSAAHNFKLGEKASINLGADVGVAGDKFAKFYGGTKGGFYHYNVLAELTFKPSKRVGISLSAGYTNSLDRDVLPEQDVHFYGGVGFSITF